MIICSKCGSDDIQQEASIMLNPNTGEVPGPHDEFHWNDYYWCKKCDGECHGMDGIGCLIDDVPDEEEKK